MAKLSKSSVQVDGLNEKSLGFDSIGLKFAPPSNVNRLNKLLVYGVVLSQKKFLENETAAQLREAISEAINKLHEMIAVAPEEHARKLQESYRALNMQPRYVSESDDEFLERLKNAFETIKENPRFSQDVFIEDAYTYLSKYASCPRINPVYAQNNGNLEAEPISKRLAK